MYCCPRRPRRCARCKTHRIGFDRVELFVCDVSRDTCPDVFMRAPIIMHRILLRRSHRVLLVLLRTCWTPPDTCCSDPAHTAFIIDGPGTEF